jgi:intraflagellar transport protein 172
MFERDLSCFILFDNMSTSLTHQITSLQIFMQYGKHELLASFCCEFISENVISLVISGEVNCVKKVAYLLDAHTICVKNMIALSGTLLVNHKHSIDFIELNYKADLLLFRDERKILYLVDLETQLKNALIDDCSYAQWVPNCNVVVSQRRGTLFVHYNMKELHDKSETEIKGNVVAIERHPDRTIVLVNEGFTVRSLP